LNAKKLMTALFLAALFILAAAQIWCRPVDRDEGFWLYTSWRLAEGELPYRDFALPHPPLAPLYYAAKIKAFGPSLYALRATNVALFAASAPGRPSSPPPSSRRRRSRSRGSCR